MSKIEKALTRASADRRSMILHPAQPEPSSSEARQLAVVGTDVVTGRSSEAIAQMRETNRRSSAELAARRVITPELGESAAVKAFRELRTNILQKTEGRNGALMVTSVMGSSGTSFVALNLSAAFAFDLGRTALLMDCNLRNPSVRRLLVEPGVSGLTDYQDDPDMDVSNIIHSVGIERLRVIPDGARRERRGEYLTSTRMKCLIDGLRARYPERFVILDAPPVMESADAQILGDLCDYVVLVVSYGTVTNSQLERALTTVDRNKLIGVVFNNEPQLPRLSRAN